MRMYTVAALVAATFSFTGCTVGPNYVRPTVEAPTAWRIDYPKAAEVANTKWWEQFGDPVLNELIETALRENLDVRVAAARVDQFIGTLGATNSQAYPQIGYSGGASRTRASREGFPPIPAPADPYFSLYQAALGATWQIDLFGRVRRLSEAASKAASKRLYGSRLADLASEVLAGTPAAYAKLIGDETEKWGKVVRAGNIKPQ